MGIEPKFQVAPTSWRQYLDFAVQQGGGRLNSIQTYFEETKADLFIDNPETGNRISVPFNPISFAVDELAGEVHKAIDADNTKSEVRRVSIKAGLLAEKAAILANMAKTLSELSLELDALAERKKQ